jgi:predicted ATP-grasp superfamily ATP-dependent carboligase
MRLHAPSARRTGTTSPAVEPQIAGAVVLGSDYRGLGVVRSLGRRGIPVWVLTGGDDVLAAKSRYALRHFPLEGESDDEHCAFLVDLVDRHRLEGWVLFPTADESAALIGRAHEQLRARYTLTTPSWQMLRWAYDKRLTYRLAESLALPYPRTWAAASAAEAAALDLEFPVIVKPAVKEELNALTVAKGWPADNRDQLRERFSEAAALVDPELLMIQEVVPGSGEEQLSYAALCDRGRPLASVAARRTRQYPPDFGRASTYVETIEAPEVAKLSERFLAEIEFDGLVEVEFKRDPRDGELKLLDVNPRVWGWHSLCQRAGVDFPYLAYKLARSEPVPRTHPQAGVRWLRLSTDLPTSLKEIVRGNLKVGPYLRTIFSPHESAIFARDDPRPALSELPMLVRTFIRRLRHSDFV